MAKAHHNVEEETESRIMGKVKELLEEEERSEDKEAPTAQPDPLGDAARAFLARGAALAEPDQAPAGPPPGAPGQPGSGAAEAGSRETRLASLEREMATAERLAGVNRWSQFSGWLWDWHFSWVARLPPWGRVPFLLAHAGDARRPPLWGGCMGLPLCIS